MVGATAAMAAFGVVGNLMSLGAIDFGRLVDGAVVMIEGMFLALRPDGHGSGALVDPAWPVKARIEAVVHKRARPVFYSVLVIVLVIVPILSLQGVDGQLFKPMALTVIFALVTSLLLCNSPANRTRQALAASPPGAAKLLDHRHCGRAKLVAGIRLQSAAIRPPPHRRFSVDVGDSRVRVAARLQR